MSNTPSKIELLAKEFVNLAPRRHLAFHIVTKADAAKASFENQKAIVYLDAEPPQGELRAKFLEFARAGGLLVSPRGVVTTVPQCAT